MMIQFKTFVKDCTLIYTFQMHVGFIPFHKQTPPGGQDEAPRGKVRSLASFPSEELRTLRKESSSDHSED